MARPEARRSPLRPTWTQPMAVLANSHPVWKPCLGCSESREVPWRSKAAAYGRRTSTTLALSASVRTVLWEEFGPVGASPVAVWARHLAMVVWLNPQRWTRLLAGSHNA